MTPKRALEICPQMAEEFDFGQGMERMMGYISAAIDKTAKRIRYLKLNGYGIEAFLEDSFNYRLTKFPALGKEDQSKIEVGMAATIVLYSDRYGCTITEIQTGKYGNPRKVGVRQNKYIVIDRHDGQCERLDDLGDETEYFSLRKGGGWVAVGQPTSADSVLLAVGYRSTYIDPNF